MSEYDDGVSLIANYLKKIESQVLLRWREQVKSDPHQVSQRMSLDDKELEDHLPALMRNVIKALRGDTVPDVEEEGRRHGHQRRADRYTVVDVLWEFTVFREVVLDMIEEAASSAQTDQVQLRIGQSLLRRLLDRNVTASVDQYMREAESERDLVAAEARELHAQRDRFLASLSHELRNHIAPIITAINVLKAGNFADSRQERAVGIIERQARHQAVLIDDLLDVNRIRYGKLDLRRQSCDLREPVKLAVESCQAAIQSKSLALRLDLPSQPVMAVVDQTRIAQVVTNLLTNSIKFTPSGGQIIITLDLENEYVTLSVRDTGLGIAQQDINRVFEMFYQANTSLDREFAGLGIGLTVAKELVGLHRGGIEVRSEGKGKGSEFIVRLPASEAPSDQRSVLSERILLVEDNADHLQILSDALSMRGHETVGSTNGQEALSRARDVRPYACIIDIGLPGMDGYEVASTLRNLPEMNGVLLIALTAYGTQDHEFRARISGFDHRFTKPADVDKLHELLVRSRPSKEVVQNR